MAPQEDHFFIRVNVNATSFVWASRFNYDPSVGFTLKSEYELVTIYAVEVEPTPPPPPPPIEEGSKESEFQYISPPKKTFTGGTSKTCEYKVDGKCTICNLKYRMFTGSCSHYGIDEVFDFVTRQNFSTSIVSASSIDSIKSKINTLAQTNMVIMNIIFEVEKSHVPGSTPMTFVVYFNSLHSLGYNPYETKSYTPTQIATELSRLTLLFEEHKKVMASFGLYQNYRIRYTVYGQNPFLIFDPTIKLGNKCYSDVLSPELYYMLDFFSMNFGPDRYTCGSGCLSGFYFGFGGICLECSSYCLSCQSSDWCDECEAGNMQISGMCIFLTIPTPGTPFTEIGPVSPSDNYGPTSAEIPSADERIIPSSDATDPVINVTNPIFFIDEEYKSLKDSLPNPPKASLPIAPSQPVKCPKGCLQCPSKFFCSKCDANYKLSKANQCSLSFGIITHLTNRTDLSKEDCSACFQTYDYIAPECQTCRQECPCLMSQSSKNGDFSFVCHNAVFDKSKVAEYGFNELYYMKVEPGEFAFSVHLKDSAQEFSLAIAHAFVKNSTGCFFSHDSRFQLTRSETNADIWASVKPSSIKQGMAILLDIAICLVSLMWPHIAISIIGFIQFNKFYFYVSMLDINIGDMANFVNSNFHDEKYPDFPRFWAAENQFEFAYISWWFIANKLIAMRSLIVCLSGMGIYQISLILSAVFGKKNLPKKLKLLIPKFKFWFQTIVMALSRKYHHLGIASLQYLLFVTYRTDSGGFQCLIISGLLFMAYFTVTAHTKILSYLSSGKNGKSAFFMQLRSPNDAKKNRDLMKVMALDDLLFTINVFCLYTLRKYPMAACVVSMCLLCAQITITIWQKSRIHFIQTVISLLESTLLIIFFVLVMLQQLDLKVSAVAFNVVYLIGNVFKLINVVSDSALVIRKNNLFVRIVSPKVHQSQDVWASPPLNTHRDLNVVQTNNENDIIISESGESAPQIHSLQAIKPSQSSDKIVL